jgi:hypothetical protein
MQKEENYYMWFFLFTIYSKSTLDNTIGPWCIYFIKHLYLCYSKSFQLHYIINIIIIINKNKFCSFLLLLILFHLREYDWNWALRIYF